MFFRRPDRPPAAALAVIGSDERVVSWADTADGSAVLATPAGLWWPDGEGWRRIGWQHVNKATWRDGELAVIEARVEDEVLLVDLPVVRVVLSVPRDLPPVVRKRVEGNVLRSEVLDVPGGQARFVARRVPGVDGLQWWARLEAGTEDSPAVREAITARVASLQAAWEASLRE